MSKSKDNSHFPKGRLKTQSSTHSVIGRAAEGNDEQALGIWGGICVLGPPACAWGFQGAVVVSRTREFSDVCSLCISEAELLVKNCLWLCTSDTEIEGINCLCVHRTQISRGAEGAAAKKSETCGTEGVTAKNRHSRRRRRRDEKINNITIF